MFMQFPFRAEYSEFKLVLAEGPPDSVIHMVPISAGPHAVQSRQDLSALSLVGIFLCFVQPLHSAVVHAWCLSLQLRCPSMKMF